MDMRTPPYGTPVTIIERDRRTENQRLRDDRDRLSRQLRQMREKARRNFDDGFQACLSLVKKGATVEHLETMVRPADSAVPVELADSTEITQVNMRSPFFEGD